MGHLRRALLKLLRGLVSSQTPLVCFVVELLHNKLYTTQGRSSIPAAVITS